jgi:hypothetical protein
MLFNHGVHVLETFVVHMPQKRYLKKESLVFACGKEKLHTAFH